MAVSFVSILSEAQRNKVYHPLLAEGDLKMGMGMGVVAYAYNPSNSEGRRNTG